MTKHTANIVKKQTNAPPSDKKKELWSNETRNELFGCN